jgi:hypothetical protein
MPLAPAAVVSAATMMSIAKMTHAMTAAMPKPPAQASCCVSHRHSTPAAFLSQPNQDATRLALPWLIQTVAAALLANLVVTCHPQGRIASCFAAVMLHLSPPLLICASSFLTRCCATEAENSRVMRAVLKYMHSQQRKEAHFLREGVGFDYRDSDALDRQRCGVSFALFLLRCSTVCKAWRKAIEAQVSW